MSWKLGQLKHWLERNDSGVWGEEPTGNGDVEVLRSTDIGLDGSWKIADPAVRSVTARDRHKKTLNTGDLVVVTSSGSEAHLGKTAIVTETVAKRQPCFANFVQRLTVSSNADARYVRYLLSSQQASEEMATLGNTTTGLRNLNGGIIGAVTCPGPPLAEQRAIADYLDAETARIDALIAKKQQLIHLLEERWQARLEEAIQELGARYGIAALKYSVANVQVGIVITPAKWYADSGFPALRGVNVGPASIDTDDVVFLTPEGHAENRKSQLASGDVVVVRTGQAGAAAVVPQTLDGANCIDLLIIRPGKGVDPEFLQFVINSDWTSKHIAEHAVGSIQAHFNVGSMKEIDFPIAPRAEQERIRESLQTQRIGWKHANDALSKQIELLAERRQALITAAVTGDCVVPRAS